MKQALIGLLVLSSLTTGGCIFVAKKPGHVESREHRACEPAHHWEDGRCVHNGRGHDKSHKSNKHKS